jgi:hypothetical protein
MTPGMLPNWESGPQNQPRAKVAVSKVLGAAVSIGGTMTSKVELVVVMGFLLSVKTSRVLPPIRPRRTSAMIKPVQRRGAVVTISSIVLYTP